MPFPPIETIREVGNQLIEKNDYSEETINEITSQWLTENIELTND